jgi:protein-L-isoaspartate(D-aspartate) O-methyltransferase
MGCKWSEVQILSPRPFFYRLKIKKNMARFKEDLRFKIARDNMISALINQNALFSSKIIDAMTRIPRHLFVQNVLWDLAYQDRALPIGEGQTISHPSIVARMTELLEVHSEHRVLEIGTGSGYQTAILARLAGKVYSVEWHDSLVKKARAILEDMGLYTARIEVGDGSQGWPEAAPFDRILVTAGGPIVPQPLLDQLAPEGKLVIPVGERRDQKIITVTRTPSGYRFDDSDACEFVDLLGKYGYSQS